MSLHIQLITPERLVVELETDQLRLPTPNGEITILPHHIPFITLLAPGVLTLTHGGKEEEIAVSGGFVELHSDNQIRILADTADRAAELDLEIIEQATQRAALVMKQAIQQDDQAYAAAAAALERELARYRVARKHRGSTHVPTLDRDALPHDENPI